MAADPFNISVVLALVDQLTGPLRNATRSMEGFQASIDGGQRLQALGNQAQATGILLQHQGQQMANALGGLVQPAIAFESAMADVRKVVEFDTPEQFAAMGDDILDLSTRLPLAVDGLAQIVTEAGQAGIARHELLAFAEDAAKMATAFDVSALEAGSAMTGLRVIFGRTQDGVVQLSDAVNFLSNNMAATAPEILQVLQRAGSTAQLIGLTAEQTAALASSFLALKTPPQVAGTAINAMLSILATAPQQSDAFLGALKGLGISAGQLKADIATDAQGALLSFLQTVRGSDDVIGTLTELFGREYADDVAKLVNSLDTYQDAIGLVGNQLSFAGSMQAEFETRSQTTENGLILFNNQLMALKMTLGDQLLPALNDVVGPISRMVGQFRDFARENSGIVRGLLIFFAGVASINVFLGTILAAYGSLVTVIGVVVAGFGKLGLAMIAARAAMMPFIATAIPALLSGLGAVGSAFTAVGGAILATPIGWLIAGAAAVGAAAWLIYDNWSGLTAWFGDLWRDLTAGFQRGFVDGLIGIIGTLNPLSLFGRLIQDLTSWAFGIDLSAIGRAWTDSILGGIRAAWSTVTGFVADAVRNITGLLPDFVKDRLGIGRALDIAAAPAQAMAQMPPLQQLEASRQLMRGSNIVLPKPVTLDREAARAGSSRVSNVRVEAPLTVTINGTADAATMAAFEEQLRAHRAQIAEIVADEAANDRRLSFDQRD